jgi:hypothetical protein
MSGVSAKRPVLTNNTYQTPAMERLLSVYCVEKLNKQIIAARADEQSVRSAR